jgi:hypothetical protein
VALDLSDVSPVAAVKNTSDRPTGKAKLFGQRDLCCPGGAKGANPANGLCGDFGPAVPFSSGLSFLGIAVRHVLGLGTEKQMVGANAKRVVAGVTNHQAGREWTDVDFPGKAVCVDGPNFDHQSVVVADVAPDVPAASDGRSRPEPAPHGVFSYVFPESHSGVTAVGLETQARAVMTLPVSCRPRVDLKTSFAGFAGGVHGQGSERPRYCSGHYTPC